MLVPREVGEGAAGDLDQLQVAAAGRVPRDPHPATLLALEVERRGRAVIAIACEEDLGCREAVAIRGGDHHGREGQLASMHREPFHVRIGRQECRADLVEPALEGRRG